ncbi:protein kinase IKS1 [Sporobolomyces salmoneus]|uniref:protein kinase IKS1 n=1 Tax=Sporobolomyces salmoneus TaxID=183962 RepID=UPI003174C49F
MPDPDPHSDWHVVLQPSSSQRKVVLWHPTLNELTVRPASSLSTVTTRDTSKRRSISSERPRIATSDVQIEPLDSEDERSQPSPLPSPPNFCPLCYSPTPRSNRSNPTPRQRVLPLPSSDPNQNETALRRIPSYFQLLSHANSRANTPTTTRQPRSFGEPDREGHPLDHTQFNEGYFAKFFEEIQVLGRGGQGVVYLVRHLLNGEALGLYACKKIPVGDSTLSLLRILREVHLLETVQHPNIVSYHHAWLETSIPASFSPAVPTLFVLMSFANGGSLFDFVCARGGGNSPTNEETEISLEERKKRFKSRKKGWISGRAVHLLSVEDILKLFGDIVHGLGFLHSRNILHLDLKAENVLLNWEDEALLPTCKLSDFGNATDSSFSIEREGDSGTLAYTAPEAFERDSETGKLTAATRATDIWGLGLILHLLCFFTLPYRHYDDNVRLEEEIRSYRGFSPSDAHALDHGTRHDIPDSLLRLIAKLVNIRPSERPNCDKILQALAEISEEVELAKLREVSLDKSEMVVRSSRVSEQVEDSATTSIASTSSVRTVAVQVSEQTDLVST